MKQFLPILTMGTLLLAGSGQAQAGLQINLNFDPSFASSFGSNAAAAESAVQFAAQQYENLFTNNININITAKGVAGTSIFGQSNPVPGPNVFQSYTTIRNALINDANLSQNPNQLQFVSTLPVNDPTGAQPGSGFGTVAAEGKALGLIPDSLASDGTITFGAGFAFTFDPNNRAVVGEFDFIGIVEHEISEVMGRIGLTGIDFGDGGPDFTPIDLARFNAGARSASNRGAGNYFSIDNGVTNLHFYNNHNANGLDTVDWASGQGPDSYNQFSDSGVVNDITPVDIMEMNILGYNLATAVATPEPTSLTLVGIGSVLATAYGWRRRKELPVA
jgi:hypothetical protein